MNVSSLHKGLIQIWDIEIYYKESSQLATPFILKRLRNQKEKSIGVLLGTKMDFIKPYEKMSLNKVSNNNHSEEVA